MARNQNPVLDIVVITATIAKGKTVKVHVCPRDQKNDYSGMTGQMENARAFAWRWAVRSNLGWAGSSAEAVQMPSNKAEKVCRVKNPNGKTQYALCA